MQESAQTRSPYTVTSKTHVLLALAAIVILGPFLDWFTMSSQTAYRIGTLAQAIAILTACIIWVNIDAAEKDIEIGHGFRVGMILLLPVVLIYYFYKSRGLKRGTITLLKAIGFYVVTVILGTIVFILLGLIDGTFRQT